MESIPFSASFSQNMGLYVRRLTYLSLHDLEHMFAPIIIIKREIWAIEKKR